MSVRGEKTVEAIEADLRKAKGLREKEERRQRVIRLAAAGVKPQEIGWRVGLRPDYVKKLVAAAKQDVCAPTPSDDAGINVMWRLGSDAERRDWIRQRAAEGARLTLQGRLS